MSFFKKLAEGLKKTKKSLFGSLGNVARGFSKVDDELFDEFEETLIMADVGVNTSLEIMDRLRDKVKEEKIKEPMEAVEALKTIMAGMIDDEDSALKTNTKPSVILVIGVNGVGKTTSIAKIAHYLKGQGKKVVLGAADTFRAAAIDQLMIWADRVGVDIIKQSEGADPASVVFDTIAAAKSRGADVIICDTAGRLHNKKNLMNELEKISRVIARELPDADKEVLLVLDATTGQNALNQAKEFKAAAEITGIVLTKLDGTAKGGIIFAVKNELSVPVKFIGVGEGMDDMQPFDGKQFVDAIFSKDDEQEEASEEDTI
ncbi:MAG: signal recognition particle-docking protein FtsY [Clostridia bacterium]|nr:signal recognition particle-docking protein FtsY [Clostridia bacterium]